MPYALRLAGEADLDQCLALTTDRFLYGEADLRALRRMWGHIVAEGVGTVYVIADTAAPSRVAFFGTFGFVSDERADAYHRLARPGLSHAMVEEFAAGGRPFLTRDEVGRSNAVRGLNFVFMHHGYEERHDESDENLRAATYEATKYMSHWNLRSYTNEVFSRDGLRDGKQMGEALGFRLRRYTGEQLRAAGIPKDRAPWVWLATPKDAAAQPASLALTLLFSTFSPPKFGLTFAEQEMLELALDGYTDESIARTAGASLSTIKKRFRTIYEKAQDAGFDPKSFVLPELPANHLHGVELRRALLNYLRRHREELRPYSPALGV